MIMVRKVICAMIYFEENMHKKYKYSEFLEGLPDNILRLEPPAPKIIIKFLQRLQLAKEEGNIILQSLRLHPAAHLQRRYRIDIDR